MITRDIEEILEIFKANKHSTVLLVSQFHTVQDMRLTAFGNDIECFCPGTPTYIISKDRLQAELELLSRDYHSYRIGTEDVCSHSWVDVGFRFEKIVCKYCDRERE